ncbi:MAG: hypothetical protein KAR83_09060 [Thermodesulfovibrionales bacterium]|nr:hypothetical protein [Thermodesulfovibrionales bacterium]
MDNNTTHERRELMETRHEEVPGYRRVFYIALATGIIYLGWLFAFGSHFFSVSGGGH